MQVAFESGREIMQVAHVSVLIEKADGTFLYRNWTGSSIKGIHGAARKRYAKEFPQSCIYFGNGYYVNYYGAH